MNKNRNDEFHNADTRRRRRRVVFVITAALIIVIAVALVWSLRPIVLPFLIGTLVAYLCFPLLAFFTRLGIPRPAGILLLFGAFFFIALLTVNVMRSIIPGEEQRLVLRTRFQYKINERYNGLMGLDKPGDTGNIFYKYLGHDLDRIVKNVNSFLHLTMDERVLFMQYRKGHENKPPIIDRYYNYFLKNNANTAVIDEENLKELKEKKSVQPGEESQLSVIMTAVKLWIIMPLVFLFLLIDDGEIKKFFISLVPNRYFEVSCTLADKVNRAIGNYLRGILLECSLVGISYVLFFWILGFETKVALIIGVIAGVANAVPLMGAAAAFVLGASYGLIAENVTSFIPIITPDNLIFAVIFTVIIVMALDNAVFQPFVLGGAVKLHPMVVFLGLIGGSMLFGFGGLLLAVPTIVVVKELVGTLFRELKEYYII